MVDYISQHPWQFGILVAILAFIFNGARRLAIANHNMPPEKKLEYDLHRAARALRQLSRARRVLKRETALHGTLSLADGQRLIKAASDADSARDHLSAVLKKIPNLGASITVMQNIDEYLRQAEETRAACRQALSGKTAPKKPVVPLTDEQLTGIVQECYGWLARAQTAMANWVAATQQAEQAMAASGIDPMIIKSGGVFRNPFKSESAVEFAQTESVLYLRETVEDINRTGQALAMAQAAVEQLPAPANSEPGQMVSTVSAALDALDSAMAGANLPLPAELANEATPFDNPGSATPSGALQQLYDCLAQVEIALRTRAAAAHI